MKTYLGENEKYNVEGNCKECGKKFTAKVRKKDVDAKSVNCSLCRSLNVEIISSGPARQILME
jgi:Zn finger protein HypA/HybF involved in hydrogenase expression